MSQPQALKTLSVLESDEEFARLVAGDIVEAYLSEYGRFLLHLDVYERPRNIVAARDWREEHATWEPDRLAFFDLLNLLESNDDIWLYESW
jgi:hypothetical protein